MPRLRKRGAVVRARDQRLRRNQQRENRNNAAQQDIPHAEHDDAVAQPEQEDLNAMELQAEDQVQLPVYAQYAARRPNPDVEAYYTGQMGSNLFFL